ncbi:ArdC-like ssDNA-binding domain-containing protein [Demequina iriomotensis]|uniref:ArdC-like ssDNA-binding domain-containing protein n=1 Tax=Demequina iriomotensis TaxID=1536641 RepID=UPI000781D401|nr:ArdC-like ssDNA-binding domain-containing protein [Demequina iriomotensis]
MAGWEATREAREARIETLHEQLTGAVERLVTGDDWRRGMEFAMRFRSRSFNNTLLIWAQHAAAYESGRVPDPSPRYVAGFNQWRALGRAVQRGQSGYMIFAPIMGRFASSTPGDTESWRTMERGEQPGAGETVRSRLIGVKPAYVWDVSQTAGDPIPEPPRPQVLDGGAPAGLWDGLAELVRQQGFTVGMVPSEREIGGANGLTDYVARSVQVRSNMDPAARVKTLAHELAHVMLHDPDRGDAVYHRGVGEVEAESAALMIAAAHGLDTSGYTIPYVTSWASSVEGKSPVAVVQDAGAGARTAAVYILDSLQTVQVTDGTPPGLTQAMRASSPDTRRAAPAPAPAPIAASAELTAARSL